ncbi:MAG TPA: PAS domain S-box protein [Rhizobiaceae bacterium]|nr:PAS domain S-box protein [Rhizobiaceae bacterium]
MGDRASGQLPAQSLRLRLLERERHILAQVATGVPLPKVLEDLILAVEAETNGQMFGSILLTDQDGTRLLHGAAPHLPSAFNDAVHGLEIAEGAGSCGTAAYRRAAVFVRDIETDPLWARFRGQTLLHGLRSCWSTPIIGADGRLLGTFGNYYREPRTPTSNDLEVIALVTRTAAAAIERHVFDEALQESEERFRTLVELSPQMVWFSQSGGEITYCNRFWQQFTGLTAEETRNRGWLKVLHPAHRRRIIALWKDALTSTEPLETEVEFKRASDGVYRYFVVRGTPIRDANGAVVRWIVIGLDIHERKQAEVARELLTSELSHRIKNVITVARSLAAISSREHPEAGAFAAELQNRLLALSVANEYVVGPHSALPPVRQDAAQKTVLGLIAMILAPYITNRGDRFELSGEDMALGSGAATALALSVHELATNALKYGALSSGSGRVRIEGHSSNGVYKLTWRELGGPPLSGAPEHYGFGTQMIARSIGGQLKGSVEHEWAPGGVIAHLSVPLANLAY